MKVKHLIRELQKCNPDAEVVLETDGGSFDSWCVEEQPDGGPYHRKVFIFSADPDPESLEYDNKDDTPQPITPD